MRVARQNSTRAILGRTWRSAIWLLPSGEIRIEIKRSLEMTDGRICLAAESETGVTILRQAVGRYQSYAPAIRPPAVAFSAKP